MSAPNGQEQSDKDGPSCSPVHCEWGDWQAWGRCSSPCGNSGVERRIRRLKTIASCGGRSCSGSSSESRPCNRFCPNGGIPQNHHCDCKKIPYFGSCCEHTCILSHWSSWGPCNATCSTKSGTKTRVRLVQDDPECQEKTADVGECRYDCGKYGSMARNGNCDCYVGYAGECCEEELCDSSPCTWCENGGHVTCSPGGRYMCDCPYPYTGHRCQNNSPTKPPPHPPCSRRGFTLYITCDDALDLYFDGVRQSAPEVNTWDTQSRFKVPGCTKVIAVAAFDFGDRAGIFAAGTNGLITDTTWRCTDTEDAGFEQPDFVETPGRWHRAYDHSGIYAADAYHFRKTAPSISRTRAKWIWVKDNDKFRVYCRKVLR